MNSSLIVVLFFVIVMSCAAQEEYAIIGSVNQDGEAILEVPQGELWIAVLSIYPVPVGPEGIWFRVRFTEGAKRYLVCEVDTFVVAFECRQVGDNIILPAKGTTHICTSEKCYNPGYLFADDGEILGCTCDDKLYEGPRRTCNHTIQTPQSEIVWAIDKAQRSPRYRNR